MPQSLVQQPPATIPPRQGEDPTRGSTESKPPRVRRRLLGNMPIRAKLGTILIVPLAAVILFAGLQINNSLVTAGSAEQLTQLSTLGERISGLAHELTKERVRASNFLGKNLKVDRVTTDEQQASTDEALTAYQNARGALSNEQTSGVQTRLDRVDDELEGLTELREQVAKRQLPQAAAEFRYSTLISDLLGINEAIADTTDNRSVTDRIRAATAFSRYKEYVGEEQTIVGNVLANRAFTPGEYQALLNALANQEAYLSQFAASATDQQRALYDEKLKSTLVADSTQLEALATKGREEALIDVQPRSWHEAITKKINLLREVEIQLGADITATSGVLRDEATRQSIINVALVLLTLVIALAVSLIVAGSMARPLRQLGTSALRVAHHSLPEVVRRLRTEDEAGRSDLDPNNLDPALVRPVGVNSRDEIGQVTQAFNAVHHEAVRVAVEQAHLRRSVSTMFVNLSRRSQLLVDRLIRHIDTLEQSEQDPDRLSELFNLDHLATRMRRNDENLLILAGADTGRRWNQPAPIADVLRAATAEVEQYTRIRLGSVDDSISISPSAVNDLVHLVAELLENATAFSSPRTNVVVDAHRAGETVIVEIEDQGIGMSGEQLAELNERLAKPPTVDVTVSRMMGLFVVGRLASRHGIKVLLRSASSGGTLAIVSLPLSVLNESRGAHSVLSEPTFSAEPPSIPTPRTPSHAAPTPSITEQLSGPTPSPALPPAPSRPAPSREEILNQAIVEAGGTPTNPPVQGDPPNSDPTQEIPLPIFEAMESEWFRSRRRPVTPPTDTPPVPEEVPAAEPEPVAESEPAVEDTSTWESPADAGWRAAELATQLKATAGSTAAGLPKRVPMAAFVPGGIDNLNEAPAPPPAMHRQPDAVRGILSSYRRGVEQARSQIRPANASGASATATMSTGETSGSNPASGHDTTQEDR